jgi:hypothetical protein
MGSLVSLPPGRDAGLPPGRAKLTRCFAELAGLDAEDKRLEAIESRLRADVDKASAVSTAYQTAIDSDATMLIDRLRNGLSGVRGSVGRRARQAGAAMIDAHSDRLVAQRALDAVTRERGEIQGKIRALDERQRGVINAVVVEAVANGLKAELTAALEAARLALTRLTAIHQAVSEPSPDYRPMRRAAIIVDASEGDDAELVVEGREIAKALSVVEAFKSALRSNPLAAAPDFPDLDLSIDPDVIYSDLRPGERRARDADPAFQPRITHKEAAI